MNKSLFLISKIVQLIRFPFMTVRNKGGHMLFVPTRDQRPKRVGIIMPTPRQTTVKTYIVKSCFVPDFAILMHRRDDQTRVNCRVSLHRLYHGQKLYSSQLIVVNHRLLY